MIRLCVCCLLLTSVLPCKADEPDWFRFYKDVDRSASPEEEILGVALDSEVYTVVRDGYPDLRLVDAQGAEAPYLLEKATASRIHTVQKTCGSHVVSLQEADENSIEIEVRLNDKEPAADGLSFFTPLKNYQRRVRVFGGNDGGNWEPLVTDGLIFDYSRYMDIYDREVKLPKNDYRRFKIVIDEVTDQQESPYKELIHKFHNGREDERFEKTAVRRRPFRIDRIELWHRVSKKHFKEDKKADYPIVEFHLEEDAKEKCTIINVRSRREPLTGLMLETTDRNFSRPAVVQIPVERGINTEWVEVGRATLSVVSFRGYHREQLKVAFPEQRQETYRIIIQNEDNRPLKITGVAAEGNVYHIVFLALKDTAYRLYYGSEAAERPSYDMATVLASLREGYQAIQESLGAQVANPDFGEKPGLLFRKLLGSKILLGIVICLMVAVLAWGLFRASRRIDEIEN